MTTQKTSIAAGSSAGRWRALKAVLIIAIVLSGTLLLAVGAMAQQSAQFDLACWSVTTGGGGARSSGNFRMTDALGQNGGGASASTNFQMRVGVVQSLDFLQPTPTPIVTPAPPPSGTVTINLPIISSYVVIQRTCPQ